MITETDAILEMAEMENVLLQAMKDATPLARKETSLTSILKRTSIYDPLLPEPNRETKVKYFFTRPRLNLSDSNIRVDRMLAKLGKMNGDSIEKYVRVILDPKLGYGFEENNAKNELSLQDEPFITLLNNTVHTVSGHPDPIIDTYESKEGLMKERVAHVDGTDKLYGTWDATLNFTNVKSEGVWLLFDTWIRYTTMVKRGTILPYARYILGRQIDYQSGLFSLVLGEDGRSIKHISSTILFPTALSKGKLYDSVKDSPKRAEDTDLSVRFKCIGADYDDPIIAFEFNRHVATFAPSLRGYLDGDISGSEYVVVPPNIYLRFNDKCIPFIDLNYGKLEWLVHKDDVLVLKTNLYKDLGLGYK